MKPISQQCRLDVINLVQNGLSDRQIAVQTGLGRSTVQRIRKKWHPEHPTPAPGRPRILSATQERIIVRSITSGKADTSETVRKAINTEHGILVSTQTIRNILKKNGLKAGPKIKKPLLSARHLKLRLDFARKYKHWTIEDWRRVVFSDETKINRLGSDGRKWCWKAIGKPLQEHCITSTV